MKIFVKLYGLPGSGYIQINPLARKINLLRERLPDLRTMLLTIAIRRHVEDFEDAWLERMVRVIKTALKLLQDLSKVYVRLSVTTHDGMNGKANALICEQLRPQLASNIMLYTDSPNET